MSFHPEMSHEEIARAKLEVLRREHRDLDTVIARMSESGADQLHLQRLKKRKLRLKDDVVRLESLLVPDIIA